MTSSRKTVTIDMNCIIDLEQGSPDATHVKFLIQRHESSECTVAVAGIAASERLRGGGYPHTFAQFSERVARLSSRPIRVLRPIGRFDVTYWDEGLAADDTMVDLERRIYGILFSQPYEWADIARANGWDPSIAPEECNHEWRRWRNRLCDAAAMWCHIHHGADIFVTRDRNFLEASKKRQLEALGAGTILSPEDACSLVSGTAAP